MTIHLKIRNTVETNSFVAYSQATPICLPIVSTICTPAQWPAAAGVSYFEYSIVRKSQGALRTN